MKNVKTDLMLVLKLNGLQTAALLLAVGSALQLRTRKYSFPTHGCKRDLQVVHDACARALGMREGKCTTSVMQVVHDAGASV